MRLMRISTHYRNYVEQFYRRNPGIDGLGYEEQYALYVADCFSWNDAWTRALQPFGYEVWEPVANAVLMQQAWAREHAVLLDPGDNVLKRITLAQIVWFQPEVLFVNSEAFDRKFLDQVRTEVRSIRLVFGWCGAVFQRLDNMKSYDFVLSNIKGLVKWFEEKGIRARYLMHGFDRAVLDRMKTHPESLPMDFSFIGSIFQYEGLHNDRAQLLGELARKSDLRIFADVPSPSIASVLTAGLNSSARHLVGRLMRGVGAAGDRSEGRVKGPSWNDYWIGRRAEEPVYGVRMFRALAASKVSLNNHIDLSRCEASNLRLFEATGVGSCLLTEEQANLRDILEPDEEVVTYENVDEAVEKVEYLLSHEEERKRIAKAGQQRVLSEHTLHHRAEELDEIVRAVLR